MNWLYKHKNKLILTSLAATGLYCGGRYLWRKLEKAQSDSESPTTINRLSEHVQSNHQTTVGAVLSLLPKLQEVVCVQLDTDSITEQLKDKPANKVALWEELKSLCESHTLETGFSRLVASVYAAGLMTSMMTVQLSILAGRMSHKPSVELSSDTHKEYLAMVEHLLGEGVVALCAVVKKAAGEVLAGYTLKQELTCQGLEQLLRDVCESTRLHAAARTRRSFLVQYALPVETLLPETVRGSDWSDAVRDVLQSAQFTEVLEACLQTAFSQLTSALTQTYHSASQSQTVLPLARVIPMVTDHTHLAFSTQEQGVVQRLLNERNLVTLSHNIYESFSVS